MKSILQVKIIYIFPVIIALFLLYLGYYFRQQEETFEKKDCIPTFVDGGGPYYKENVPFRKKIVPDQNNGERLTVKGRILKNDCKTPVGNVTLDIWQASEEGSYQEVDYRGKVISNKKGEYEFETVIPKGYGEGTGYRPPHIHFKVYLAGREVITSQMFFPEAHGQPGFDDAYNMDIKTIEIFKKKFKTGHHDIILP